MKSEPMGFFKLIRDFLTIYLPKQKAASPHTIKSYKNTICLFVGYSVKNLEVAMVDLDFQHLSRELIISFLDGLENDRHYSIASRNQRLAGLRAFYKYAAGRDPILTAFYQELLCIPKKKQSKNHQISYFSEDTLQIILDQPDTKSRYGLRNLMLMILLYDTGARVQEILDVQLENIHLAGSTPYLTITGKGKKTRMVPLMKKTVEHLEKYMSYYHQNPKGQDNLFYTTRKGHTQAMSPDNVSKFIKKYGEMARNKDAKLPTSLHPHMFRHYGE